MKKNKFLMVLLIVGILFFTGCYNDDEEEPTLQIPQSVMSFETSGGEKTVKVIINEDDRFWAEVQSGINWTKLKQNNDAITVSVDKNTSIEPRSCIINVATSNFKLIKTITVEQKGVNPELSLSPDSVEFDQFAGEKIIDVNTNMNEIIKVEGVPEWATVVAKFESREIKITVEENKSRKSRDVQLIVTSGKMTKLLKLHQEGTLYYLLPYLQFKGTILRDVVNFENARHSVYAPDALSGLDRFYTISPICPMTAYIFDNEGVSTSIGVTKLKATDENKDFKDWIGTNGYSHIFYDKIYLEDVWYQNPLKMMLVKNNAGNINMVFNFSKEKPVEPIQDSKYSTWDRFPFGIMHGKVDDVIKWETEHGGKISNKTASEIDFSVPGTEFTQRAYFFDGTSNEIFEKMYLINKPHMVLFIKNGRKYPTKEFDNIMALGGFEFSGINEDFNDALIYTNPQNGVSIYIRYGMVKDFPGIYFAALNITTDNSGGNNIHQFKTRINSDFIPVDVKGYKLNKINEEK